MSASPSPVSMDDIDILKELCRSVYVTPRQKDALRRVLVLVSRGRPLPLSTKVTDGATSAEPAPGVTPLLGPGDAQ